MDVWHLCNTAMGLTLPESKVVEERDGGSKTVLQCTVH